ncbi:MAG: DMT family transporter [Alphaproteobacteria bacterium]|nr:DMT family transporter [Alphaproteobacteria bacterium]
MEHLWIAIVLLSAGLQTARNAGQKHLSGRMSALSATWVRFGYGLPFAVLYLVWAVTWFDQKIPELGPNFLIPSAMAAFLQVAGTVLLIFLFRMRNFAIGSTYVRSEAIVAAILGTTFFGETVGLVGWIAITISVAGVVMISLVRSGIGGAVLVGSIFNLSAGVGLMAGLAYALGSFFIREASLSFGHTNFMLTASVTLVTVITIQTVALGLFLLITKPSDFLAIARLWKSGLFVGVTSAFGSMGWFTAMTIQKVSYVKALAQVELIFALGVSILFFQERSTRNEMFGMALVALGIVVLVLFAK